MGKKRCPECHTEVVERSRNPEVQFDKLISAGSIHRIVSLAEGTKVKKALRCASLTQCKKIEKLGFSQHAFFKKTNRNSLIRFDLSRFMTIYPDGMGWYVMGIPLG